MNHKGRKISKVIPFIRVISSRRTVATSSNMAIPVMLKSHHNKLVVDCSNITFIVNIL